jgi:hypothetical protein
MAKNEQFDEVTPPSSGSETRFTSTTPNATSGRITSDPAADQADNTKRASGTPGVAAVMPTTRTLETLGSPFMTEYGTMQTPEQLSATRAAEQEHWDNYLGKPNYLGEEIDDSDSGLKAAQKNLTNITGFLDTPSSERGAAFRDEDLEGDFRGAGRSRMAGYSEVSGVPAVERKSGKTGKLGEELGDVHSSRLLAMYNGAKQAAHDRVKRITRTRAGLASLQPFFDLHNAVVAAKGTCNHAACDEHRASIANRTGKGSQFTLKDFAALHQDDDSINTALAHARSQGEEQAEQSFPEFSPTTMEEWRSSHQAQHLERLHDLAHDMSQENPLQLPQEAFGVDRVRHALRIHAFMGEGRIAENSQGLQDPKLRGQVLGQYQADLSKFPTLWDDKASNGVIDHTHKIWAGTEKGRSRLHQLVANKIPQLEEKYPGGDEMSERKKAAEYDTYATGMSNLQGASLLPRHELHSILATLHEYHSSIQDAENERLGRRITSDASSELKSRATQKKVEELGYGQTTDQVTRDAQVKAFEAHEAAHRAEYADRVDRGLITDGPTKGKKQLMARHGTCTNPDCNSTRIRIATTGNPLVENKTRTITTKNARGARVTKQVPTAEGSRYLFENWLQHHGNDQINVPSPLNSPETRRRAASTTRRSALDASAAFLQQADRIAADSGTINPALLPTTRVGISDAAVRSGLISPSGTGGIPVGASRRRLPRGERPLNVGEGISSQHVDKYVALPEDARKQFARLPKHFHGHFLAQHDAHVALQLSAAQAAAKAGIEYKPAPFIYQPPGTEKVEPTTPRPSES